MSSSVFTETPSSRPAAADGDSNLVVVYSKHGISFDERGIENIMEEKSISTISVVRLTSPTPSMVEEEEVERLEELERFLETATDRDDSDRDSDDGSRSDDAKSERGDHVTGDDNDDNSGGGGDNNDDSTETEAEAPTKLRKRPGRKPKVVKKPKKRRKPKERPQIVGLSVEQFYTDSSADMVVKNALKMAGLSVFKRTAESDALLEIIRNDHNYTPFTSPEQMKAHKIAEKLAVERQPLIHGRSKFIVAPGSIKFHNPKKRLQTMPLTLSQVQATAAKQQEKLQQLKLDSPKTNFVPPLMKFKRSSRIIVKVPGPVEEHIEDDDDANSSANADDENVDADKSYDTEDLEQLSELSDESHETDNDRDSDIDFKMNNSRTSNKRKNVKKLTRRSFAQSTRHVTAQAPKPLSQQFPHIKRRKRSQEHLDNRVVSQVNKVKLEPIRAPVNRGAPNPPFLKVRTANKCLPTFVSSGKSLTPEAPRLASTPIMPSTAPPASNVRRTPIVQVGSLASTSSAAGFLGSPQEIKEIVINKNLTSPKGVFTNLNTLLAENKAAKLTPRASKQRLILAPASPCSTVVSNTQRSSHLPSPATPSSKGFMPIGVETAASHKLPAQIVIETHQSSSELAAENDKQLDLINSIVQDELLKTSFVEQQPTSADESIPKIVKMLESTAAGLDQTQAAAPPSFDVAIAADGTQNVPMTQIVDDIDMANAQLLETPDEDEITADFLQHVVGLIEEDKQFEAEVVKQVLASAEPADLDAIANAVSLPSASGPIFNAGHVSIAQQAPNLTANIMLSEPLNPLSIASSAGPIACSTPSRSTGAAGATTPLAMRPEVKIVRGNGRVIYLPPIEAPTTRAKRRAQNTPTTTSTTTLSATATEFSSSSLLTDTTAPEISHGLLSLDSDSLLAQSVGKMTPESAVRKPMPREPGRFVGKRSVPPRRSKKMNMSHANDTEASESQEDDDDPNKLWCICRQPHNNRFMICCDLCEDWYHGTCVNVTKAMGLDMEQKGIDWKCPKCVKKQEEKSQPRITEMLVSKRAMVEQSPPQQMSDAASHPMHEVKVLPEQQSQEPKHLHQIAQLPAGKQPKRMLTVKLGESKLQQQQLNFVKVGGSSPTTHSEASSCIVCKRLCRNSSVYCSDECIRKYAQAAIQTQSAAKSPEPAVQAVPVVALGVAVTDAKKNKKKDLFEDVLRQADSMSKVDRINVFERKSGRVISGQLAPTVQQLKKWLQDNPTFEVVQPGSVHAVEIEKRQAKRTELFSDSIPILKTSATPTAPSPTTSRQHHQVESQTSNSSTALKSMTANSPLRALPKKEKGSVKCAKEKPIQRSGAEPQSASKPEPIRLNVRRTLTEQLLARIKEAQVLEAQSAPTVQTQWLSAAEVEHFAKSVESEMYHSFGRDVGTKYKSKYRSLMFNIKDRKNKTLFEKICAKQVEPKQLVRMTPAELASQELAKWREEENRHQLDMIKKSELDLLSCSQNYVVKTHKGEEVIETKLDVSLPDESQVVLDSFRTTQTTQPSSEVLSITNSGQSKELENAKNLNLERSGSTEKHTAATSKEKEREREKEKSRERDRDRLRGDKRHRSHKQHHHHLQSGTKRSRSRSSSRSHSLEKRHRSTPRQHHNEHDQHKEKEQPEARDKPRLQEEVCEKSAALKKPGERKAEETNAKPPAAYNLVDQILESGKTVEQAANLVQASKPTHKTLAAVAAALSPARSTAGSPTEPQTSTDKYVRYVKSLPTVALWSGNLNMVDEADFQVIIHPVHGNAHQLGKLLPPKLDVIGRITRINVWEYIKKIKKSPTKEIVVVSLLPAEASESANFKQFFDYLDSRQRLGVLAADTNQIRDFYIFPLGAHEKLPHELHTSDRVPFYEDANRPDTLLGIIVRCIGKRAAPGLPPQTPTNMNASSKSGKLPHKARATFTPPSSPKRKHSTHSTSSKDDEFDIDAIIKAPIAAKTQKPTATESPATEHVAPDDPNAPYSPGGSSGDDDMPSSTTTNKEDLKRKVDEINKQIAAQRMEIAGLLNVEPSGLDKSTTTSNVLASISIPANLSKILASIKDKSEAAAANVLKSTDEEYNPEDAISSTSSYAMAKLAEKSSGSRLAQLSEAELLSMVPDDLMDATPSSSTRYEEEPPPPGV